MYHLQNKGVYFFIVVSLFLSATLFPVSVSAVERFFPGEAVVIGEFIYNDDYTPTTDDCTISIYSPSNVALVDEVTMSDTATGWHYYAYTIPGTEGKYPTFITCGTLIGGDLLKLDKSFVVVAKPATQDDVLSASSSVASVINANTDASVLTASSSLGSSITSLPATIWAYGSRTLSSFGTLVADIWASGSRTLTSVGTLVADIWGNATRTLTGADLDSGSLATQSDVNTASTSLGSLVLAVKAKTDTVDWTDITTVKNNVATLITEVGTGNISGIKTNTDTIDWSDVTGLVTSNGLIKAKTDTIAWADVTGIKTNTDTIDWSDVTGIQTKTDTILWTDVTTLATNLANASTSIASVVNANTNSQVASAITTINNNTNATVLTASSSLFSTIPTAVWSSTSRSLTTFGSLVSDIWANGTRTLTSGGGASAADVWSYATRRLSDGVLDSGSLATQSDVNTASTSLGSLVLAVKAKTDTVDWTDITTVKNNVATLITEVGTGNISGIKTNTDTIDWSDVTGLVTSNGLIKAKTDTIAWADVTGIKTNTDTIDWSDVTGIQTKTDTILWTDVTTLATNLANASTSIASVVNANTNSQVASAITTINNNTNATVLTASSSLASAISSLPATIWAYSSRTLSNFGTLVSDIWASGTRTLTSSTAASWSLTSSDFDSLSAGSVYRAQVNTVFDGTLTDSLVVPTVTLYDPSRNVVVSNVPMTRTSDGTYTYAYTTSVSAEAGAWEAVFSANVDTGKNLSANDYWYVTTSPAQVLINSVSDVTIPEIGANITITNEGLTGNEYQYEWCVVSSDNNQCGGGDDVFHAVAAKYINPGEDFNTTLTATVPSVGSYYFKVVVYFGTDSSVASRSFTAIAGTGGGGGGGGGGSGGTVTPPVANPVIPGQCNPADLNCDGKINSIDFSILLYFWKSSPPFLNTKVDMNKDNKVDSVDFSILLYHWGK